MSEVAREEELARFLFDKKEIRSDGSLHWRAFLPNRDGETSVSRVSGCKEGDVILMGFEVAKARGQVLVGRGEILAANVYDLSLKVRGDQDPASRHADILGWPEEKDRKQAIAIALAEKASAKRL
ncbi:MAG: hypothetical protein OEY86_20095 [Nitrospira sp.]|nr:hypothetical protein [Nitrospira sp.]